MSARIHRRTIGGLALVVVLLLTGAVAPSAVAAPTTGTAPTAGTAAAAAASEAETAVFRLLNRQRAQNGLPALRRNAKLVRAALGHNHAMSAAQTLSHQLPGEPSFDQRITNAGYVWRAAAENIAYTSQTTTAGAIAMQNAFFNETPPNDGHRRNILSTSVTEVGISVLIDGRGRLWITEDFAAPR